MTSSNRISLILLVFFLLPTVVSPLKCYQGERPSPLGQECPRADQKCLKTFDTPAGPVDKYTERYGCIYDTATDGWQIMQFGKDKVYVLVCSVELCNTVLIHPLDEIQGNGTGNSSLEHSGNNGSTGGTGHMSAWLFLMGLMTSWLLVIN